jgi:LacI family transcriptional regulator
MSGQGYVAPAVRLRVQEVAESFGYVPHAMARHLRQQVSRSLGLLVSDLRNSFYAELAAGASQQARASGYTVVLADDCGAPQDEVQAAEAFVAQRVAGVIVTPVSAVISGYLTRQRMPVVEVDRQFAPSTCDAVVVDNESAARRVTEHLIGQGHRRIALLIDETHWTTGRDRQAGYAAALTDAGIPADPALVVSSGWSVDGAHSAARELLREEDRPTAVFAANNVLAEGVWRAAADLHLGVPDDISLVTFDDAPWMSMVTPGVTAVAQDAVALGEAAVARLLDRIADPDAAVETVVLPVRVVARGSTGPPPSGRL